MRREDFEHVLAAAADVSDCDELVVVGSQAILGSHNDPPSALLVSLEVDVYPLENPEAAINIDGALGDGSQFHRTFGYYAHGVGPETAKAPAGWQGRLVRREIPRRVASNRTPIAWCLEIHDLVLSKCAAGRERDWEYAREALKSGLLDADVLLARIPDLPVAAQTRDHIEMMLRSIISAIV